jgi:hypothetical protein
MQRRTDGRPGWELVDLPKGMNPVVEADAGLERRAASSGPSVVVVVALRGPRDAATDFALSVVATDEMPWAAAAFPLFGNHLNQCSGILC